MFNFFISGDEYINVNSSGSTLSDTNSLQSASTLEEVEIKEKTSVDSGFGSRNVILADNNVCELDRKVRDTNVLEYVETYHHQAIVDDMLNLDLNNRQARTNSESSSDNVFHSPGTGSPISSDDRSYSKDSDIVGFSPHIHASTPKNEDNNKQDFATNRLPEKTRLDFNEVCLRKEVWTSDTSTENINDTDLSYKKQNDTSSSSEHNRTGDFECLPVIGTISREKTESADSDFIKIVDPIICNNRDEIIDVNTKNFSEYAIRTSEYGSLGSPLSEEEFNDNGIENRNVFDSVEPRHKKSSSFDVIHINQDKQEKTNNTKNTNENDILSSDEDSLRYLNTKPDFREPKIDNFMREISSNEQVKESVELSPKKEKSSRIVQGFYYGQAKHKDGSLLPVLFEVGSYLFWTHFPYLMYLYSIKLMMDEINLV